MLKNKRVVLIAALVVLAIAAISVNTVFGAGGESAPGTEHAPACHQLDWFAPGVWGLECADAGGDIVRVGVRSTAKYDLTWDGKSVLLYIYPKEKGDTAMWYVEDSNGSFASGRFK